MKTRDLTQLLYPESIAVIGASRTPGKLGNIVIKNITASGFKGRVYPINPGADVILDLTCFPSVLDLPETPELAIISLPAALVIETVHQIIEKGIKNLVIFSAGFKEAGEEGIEREKELIKLAEQHGLNLIGPNCLGFVNNLHNLNASFGFVVNTVGNLKFISQSGAIASSVFDWAMHTNFGFSEFITLGNKSVLGENEIMHYWHEESKKIQSGEKKLPPEKEHELRDERISRVTPYGLYLESIDNGQDFLKTISEVTKTNPVFILKPGRSKAAQKAMQSHTGAIAGEDAVMDAAFEQAGAIRCVGVEDFFDFARGFAWEDVPKGPNVAIVSNAGGPAVISSDFIELEGLRLVEISETTKTQLHKHLPRAASVVNPIDVLGDALAIRYAKAIDIVLGQQDVNMMLVILTPQIMTEIHLTAEFIGNLAKTHKKPIFCSFMGGMNIEKGEKVLNMYRIPSFRFPERAIRTMGKMWWWKNNVDLRSAYETTHSHSAGVLPEQDSIKQVIAKAKKDKRSVLNNFESNEILKGWGINTPPTADITTLKEALQFTSEHGWPVVLKVSSSKILHKSDLGGVIVNINNRQKLQSSLKTMQERISKLDPEVRRHTKIQIQKQITGGKEIIVGVKHDANFGPVMMFGAGGTLAEIIQDRNLKMLPINEHEATDLIEQSKIFKLLEGYRGEKPYDTTRLKKLLTQVSNLVQNFPDIADIEINPVIITYDNVWAVDGKIMLHEHTAE